MLKNIIDADFEEEYEINNAAAVPTSSEMRNIMKSALSSSQPARLHSRCFCHKDTFQRLKKISRHRIRAHNEQLSEFERDRLGKAENRLSYGSKRCGH
ncbi:hypothetical protein TNCV_4621521 [Trichonephila clavipes]|nr:hypothetical protein TNCV_4621521 [Trichonephila clavipes]